MVEQRGVEPLTSALRTRRSAKLSYCPTRRDILGSAREECQGVGEGAVEFLDVFAAALCHVGAAAAASREPSSAIVCGFAIRACASFLSESASRSANTCKTTPF